MDDNCGEWVESSAKLEVWMTIVESGWNLWVCLGSVANRRQVWQGGVGGIYGCA